MRRQVGDVGRLGRRCDRQVEGLPADAGAHATGGVEAETLLAVGADAALRFRDHVVGMPLRLTWPWANQVPSAQLGSNSTWTVRSRRVV
jgi:hypothetical protein